MQIYEEYVAQIIDIFAFLYRWSPAVILDLSLDEISLLLSAAGKRVEQNNNEKKTSTVNFTKKEKKKDVDGHNIMKAFAGLNAEVVEDLS